MDLIFHQQSFAFKTVGIFRNVLNSESPDDVRKILGKEDYGDENVMGAMLAYDKQGFQVNYLGKDVNRIFDSPVSHGNRSGFRTLPDFLLLPALDSPNPHLPQAQHASPIL